MLFNIDKCKVLHFGTNNAKYDMLGYQVLDSVSIERELGVLIQGNLEVFEQCTHVLEKVQHRATKLVSGLEKLTYEERLDLLGLTTLEEIKLRGYMIEIFKIMRGFYEVSSNTFFTLSSRGFCGHSLKVI